MYISISYNASTSLGDYNLFTLLAQIKTPIKLKTWKYTQTQ